MQDKDAMKNTMIAMSQRIGSSSLPPKDKHQKLSEFFAVNEKTLQILGPDTFLSIKNEIGDILRRIGGE